MCSMKCKTCGKELNKSQISQGNKFCSCRCSADYRNFIKIQNWLETGDAGISVGSTLRSVIRDYIFNSQDKKCAICGIESIWNDKPLNFVLDHIDGDASNNIRDNLRLICPNCDSQLSTFKSRNKVSARRQHRHKYN